MILFSLPLISRKYNKGEWQHQQVEYVNIPVVFCALVIYEFVLFVCLGIKQRNNLHWCL